MGAGVGRNTSIRLRVTPMPCALSPRHLSLSDRDPGRSPGEWRNIHSRRRSRQSANLTIAHDVEGDHREEGRRRRRGRRSGGREGGRAARSPAANCATAYVTVRPSSARARLVYPLRISRSLLSVAIRCKLRCVLQTMGASTQCDCHSACALSDRAFEF